MSRYIRCTLTILIVFFINGCGELGPSHSEIKDRVQMALPGHIKLNELTIQAEVNEGTEVDKIISTRFLAKVSVREATYKKLKTLNGIDILKEVNPQGYSASLYGVAQSIEKAGKWTITLRFENADSVAQGWTRANFAPTAILSTSPEIEKLEIADKAAKEKLRIKTDLERSEKIQRQLAEKKKLQKAAKLKLAKSNAKLEELLNSGKTFEGMRNVGNEELPFIITLKGNGSSVKYLKTSHVYKMVQPKIIKSTTVLMMNQKSKKDLYRWDLKYDEVSNTLTGTFFDERGRSEGTIIVFIDNELAIAPKTKDFAKLELEKSNAKLEELLNSGKTFEGMRNYGNEELPFVITLKGNNSSVKYLKTNHVYKMVQPRTVKSKAILMISQKSKKDLYRWDLKYDEASNTLTGSFFDERGRSEGAIVVNL